MDTVRPCLGGLPNKAITFPPRPGRREQGRARGGDGREAPSCRKRTRPGPVSIAITGDPRSANNLLKRFFNQAVWCTVPHRTGGGSKGVGEECMWGAWGGARTGGTQHATVGYGRAGDRHGADPVTPRCHYAAVTVICPAGRTPGVGAAGLGRVGSGDGQGRGGEGCGGAGNGAGSVGWLTMV